MRLDNEMELDMSKNADNDLNQAVLDLCNNHSFATGHGDTLADIIREVDGQIAEREARYVRIMRSLHHAWSVDGTPSQEALDFCKQNFD